MPDEAAETLRRLEERLLRASDAAERLMGEAAKPPPAGWQSPSAEAEPGRSPTELDSLIAALRSLRELIPPDVAERLAAAIRELLMALRALIDWYLERVERRRSEPPEIQDIPIQ